LFKDFGNLLKESAEWFKKCNFGEFIRSPERPISYSLWKRYSNESWNRM